MASRWLSLINSAPTEFLASQDNKEGLEKQKAAFEHECSLYKSGSPGRIRTGDLSINSRMLYR
jgi:hypothetical protein